MTDAGAGSPRTSLLFDVFALDQAVGRLLATALRDGPLTPREYAVYSAIFELEAASPTLLAARLGMRLTTFLDQLRAIEARGHARRVRDPRDRRAYRVTLTDAGLAAHRSANERFAGAHAAVLANLPQGEAAAKAGLLVVRRATDAAIEGLAGAATPRPTAGHAG